MMISTLPHFSTLAAAACFAAMLTSCETTGGGGHVSSTDPRVIQAKKALLDSLGEMTVRNQWVMAQRTDNSGGSLQKTFGAAPQPYISSDITTDTTHYSGWRLGDDSILRGHYSSQCKSSSITMPLDSSGELSIPVLKTDRIFIHDQEMSPELHAMVQADTAKMFEGMLGKESHQTLAQNLTHTATVEFVRGRGKPQNNTYDRIYFPSRQRAQQFVDRWNALVAALRQ